MNKSSGVKIFAAIVIVLAATVFFLKRPMPGKSPDEQKSVLSGQQTSKLTFTNSSSAGMVNDKESVPVKSSETAISQTFVSMMRPEESPSVQKNISSNIPEKYFAPIAYFSRSVLSPEEQKKATSFLESQHTSWLAVQNGSARYKTRVRIFKDGAFTDVNESSQTGAIEFAVMPLSNPPEGKSPVNIRVRISNDKSKWNVVSSDIFSKDWLRWSNDVNKAVKTSRDEQRNESFDAELLFLPLDYMAKAYPDNPLNRRQLSKEDYLKEQGVAIRRSTAEETNNRFGGEQQYLFEPFLTKGLFWFSADKGELRQFDAFDPARNVVRNFRYEDYMQKNGEVAKFPRKFVTTFIEGTGDKAMGWEQTVELTDLELNTNISPDRFILSQASR